MKHIIIFILALMPFVWGCEKDELSDSKLAKVREVAWKSLDEGSRSTTTTKWEEAFVEETTYEGKTAYAVRFNTTDEALLGPIVVYISKPNLSLLGYKLRL